MSVRYENVLVTVPSFSARCVSASKLLRENNFNLIIKNNMEHLLKSESTALRESICAVIAGKDGYQADTLSLLPGVRIISRFGTGIDNIDLRAAQQSGIVVNNAVGINSNAVAEFIIGLIFASMRNILAAIMRCKMATGVSRMAVNYKGNGLAWLATVI